MVQQKSVVIALISKDISLRKSLVSVLVVNDFGLGRIIRKIDAVSFFYSVEGVRRQELQ